MPPFAFTQLKYAAVMFSMSLKSVPGCLVSMPPKMIGVPVAATPGFVPHAEALTVPELAGAEVDVLAPALEVGADAEPVLELELHPARTPPTARTEVSAAASRHLRGWVRCIIHCLLVATPKMIPNGPGSLRG